MATVSQHPAALVLAEVMGCGAERSGGGPAMLLIHLAVGGDSFQSISAPPLSSIRQLTSSSAFLSFFPPSDSSIDPCSRFPILLQHLSRIDNVYFCHLRLICSFPPFDPFVQASPYYRSFFFLLTLACLPFIFSHSALSCFPSVFIHPSRNHTHIQAVNW